MGTDTQHTGRTASVLYELAVIGCGIWLLIAGASWIPFTVFIVANIAALGIFSNRFCERERFLRRPLDSSVALVGHALLLGFPAILLLDGEGRVRCLIALAVMVGVRSLMKSPPYSLPRRRRGHNEFTPEGSGNSSTP